MSGADGKCSRRALAVRDANPEIPIIPPEPVVPKPVVPVAPKPIAPGAPEAPGHMPEINPNPPKPQEPAPQPPKPQEPAPQPPKPQPAPQPKPGEPAPVCKRSPGGDCSDVKVTPFQDKYIDGIRGKGADSQAALEKAQKADPLKDVERDPVSKNYQGQGKDDEAPYIYDGEAKDFWLNKQFPEIEYSENVDWRTSTIRNQGVDISGHTDNVILSTYERPQVGTMIIADSKNAEKDALKGKPEQLRWSDMVMNNWVKASKDEGNENPDKLKYMIRNNIQDGDSAQQTQTAINAAILRTKGDGTAMQTFRSDPKKAGDDELAAYQLIAGTAHGDRVLKMLADYPKTMKNVRIESFSVFTPKTQPGPGEYAIVIKFYKVDG